MPLNFSSDTSPASGASRSFAGPWRAWKQAGLVLLCLAWVTLGLIGHAPWKVEDAQTIVAAWEMVQTQDFLVPRLIGEPYFVYGPLVPQLASLTMMAATPWLEPHDAARLTAGVLLLITLVSISLAGRELGGKTQRWIPMLILIGSVGLFERAHQLSPQLGLMAAMAISLWALALAPRRAVPAGLLLGGALAMGTFAYNISACLWLLVPALLLPWAHPHWRKRSFGVTLVTALLLALLLCALWPMLLYARSPELLAQWWSVQDTASVWSGQTNVFGNLGWLGRNLPWIAWPAWPLIAWLCWIRGRGFNGGFRTPAVVLPLCTAVVALLMLLCAHDIRALEVLVLLVPLALLAAVEVDTLPRSGSAGLDWFGILTFGLTAILLWFFWWDAYINGLGSYAATLFRDAEVGYQPTFRLRSASVSLLLTILWIMLVRPARQSNQRAVLNWAAGMMLIWGLVATIWMPYVDSRRSYEVVAHTLRPYAGEGCMASREVGIGQRAIFYYFAGAQTVPEYESKAAACPLLLVQYNGSDAARNKTAPALVGYETLQSGRRYGDDTELYVVYRKAML